MHFGKSKYSRFYLNLIFVPSMFFYIMGLWQFFFILKVFLCSSKVSDGRLFHKYGKMWNGFK